MQTRSQLKILNNPSEHKEILSKLPRQIQERWLHVIDRQIHGSDGTSPDSSTDGQQGEYPSFSEFWKFIAREAHIACSPLNQKGDDTKGEGLNPTKLAKPSHVRSFASKTAEKSAGTGQRSAPNDSGPPKTSNDKACVLCKNEQS